MGASLLALAKSMYYLKTIYHQSGYNFSTIIFEYLNVELIILAKTDNKIVFVIS